MRNTDLFDDFLKGHLSPQEQASFEARLHSDAEFQEEFLLHKNFVEQIDQTLGVKQLKAELEVIHEETFGKPNVVSIRPVINYYKIAAVAAGISLLVFLGGISLYRLGIEKSNENQYQELVKRTVQSMEKATRTLEKRSGEQEKKFAAPANYEATGFAISSKGYFITSLHSVKNADSVVVQNEKLEYETAEKVWEDPHLDVAVFKLNNAQFLAEKIIPFSFRHSQPDLGEKVFTLGYPRETVVYAEGNVSAASGLDGDTTKYQLSMLINPGNSGSPVLDEQGNLVGLISGRNASEQGVSYAVKTEYIYRMIQEIPDEKLRSEIVLNGKNNFRNSKRTEQIKKLTPYIFNVKIYASKN